MDTTFSTTGLAQTTRSTRRVFNLFRRYWGAFQERRKRERLRADLCGLDDRELQDIGITRGEVDYVVSNRSIDPRGVRSCFDDCEIFGTGKELSVSALFEQERIVTDAQVKMLPSCNRGVPRRLYRSTVARITVLSAIVFLGIGTAYSHDPKRPELNAWFKNLKNKAGEACCDSGDGQHAEAVWDMTNNGYKVLLRNPQQPDKPGQWFDVPNSVLISQPNLSGVAMVWWWPTYGEGGAMTPGWRCFIPGAGG